jgi:hypothetical protein
MYEVSPERGPESTAGVSAAVALGRELEFAVPALGDDGAELGVHGARLSFVDIVRSSMD